MRATGWPAPPRARWELGVVTGWVTALSGPGGLAVSVTWQRSPPPRMRSACPWGTEADRGPTSSPVEAGWEPPSDCGVTMGLFWGSPPPPPPLPPLPGDQGGRASTQGVEPRASTHSGSSSSTRGVEPRVGTHSGSSGGSEDQGGVGAGAQGRREDPIEVTDAPPRLARTCGRRALVRPRSSPAAPEEGGSQSKRLNGVPPPPPAARVALSPASTLATMPSGHGRSSTSST